MWWWCVCLHVSMRGMPPQPHPPVAEGAWLRPRPARQSPDCRRGRVHRHASRRPKRVRLKAAAFPAQHIRSALSQGRGRRCGAPPAPADSCGAPRPHAARSAVARLGRNTSRRRIGGISLASVRVSRRHRLRLVPPPLQPAPLVHGTGRKRLLGIPRKACFSTVSWGLSLQLRAIMG